MAEFDYVVVGGGSSGCVLAARLSEDPSARVLLIESGRRDRSPWIHIPATFFRVNRGGRDVIMYQGEAQPELDGRPFVVPQGHVIGGGSSINAMIYIRGQAEDYDTWAQMGCRGWSYDEVLPVFRDLEDNTSFENAYHGRGGPLGVSAPRHVHPLSRAFLDAARAVGLPENPDFNGARQEGMGFFQTTTREARRCSAARAFLAPAMRRPNLLVLTETRVARVEIARSRASAVICEDGRRFAVRREVVLCADTTVCMGRRILGKPADGQPPADAKPVEAARAPDDSAWTVLLPGVEQVGPIDVTAQAVNSVGLSSFATVRVNVTDRPSEPGGSIRGQVAEGGRAQPELKVTLTDGTGKQVAAKAAGATGAFRFGNLKPGKYTLSAVKQASGRKAEAAVTVSAGKTSIVSLELTL